MTPTIGHEAETEPGGEHIGHGVYIRRVTKDGELAGLIVSHTHEDGKICSGHVAFDVPANATYERPKWSVLSYEPLTLDPSIQDSSCSLHGHIREGKWTPA